LGSCGKKSIAIAVLPDAQVQKHQKVNAMEAIYFFSFLYLSRSQISYVWQLLFSRHVLEEHFIKGRLCYIAPDFCPLVLLFDRRSREPFNAALAVYP